MAPPIGSVAPTSGIARSAATSKTEPIATLRDPLSIVIRGALAAVSADYERGNRDGIAVRLLHERARGAGDRGDTA